MTWDVIEDYKIMNYGMNMNARTEDGAGRLNTDSK